MWYPTTMGFAIKSWDMVTYKTKTKNMLDSIQAILPLSELDRFNLSLFVSGAPTGETIYRSVINPSRDAGIALCRFFLGICPWCLLQKIRNLVTTALGGDSGVMRLDFGLPPRPVHRLCGVIERRLSHFLPHWLRTGWQSATGQGKIPRNTPP